MRLNKEIKLKNGIITRVHKINSYDIDTIRNTSHVRIISYINEELYNNDLKKNKISSDIEMITNSINIAIAEGNSQEVISALQEKLEALTKELEQYNKDFHANLCEIDLKNLESTSLESLYKALIQVEYFNGAEIIV